MSKARGNLLQNVFARYCARWWPSAESAGAGRQGRDVLGTPGVAFEVKTAMEFRRDFKPAIWLEQAKHHAVGTDDIPVVVYFPPGIAEANVGNTMAILPTHVLMHVLVEAGYAPAERTDA